ncbi:hypothetical protein M8J77_013752 [Diaphorina citri]|nr:hypothetical protein M8J77_013752 [Diaphorina citri]
MQYFFELYGADNPSNFIFSGVPPGVYSYPPLRIAELVECSNSHVLPPFGADAPIMGHLWEYCIASEVDTGYTPEGNTIGKPEFTPPKPIRLLWEFTPPALAAIDRSYQVVLGLLNEIDLRILVHSAFGKGLMKTCKISPDAFIQMALQLAYYRDARKFSLTYEASMTRLYREGRTETVRPCTIESATWVKAMEDPKALNEDKIRLLKAAAGAHQRGYQDAMCGKGIDRHLFCLYVVSKYLEVDSPFLKVGSETPMTCQKLCKFKCYFSECSVHPGFNVSN